MILYTNYLISQIQKQAKIQPNKIAVETTKGQKITWQELNQKVDNLAINLVKKGFKKDDKVFFFVKHSIEAIITLIGVVRAGGILVTADPGMGAENLKSRVALTKPNWVFCESIVLAMQKFNFIREFAKQKGIEIPEMQDIFKDTKIIRVRNWLPGYKADYNFLELLKPAKDYFEEIFADNQDFQITFTSGTLKLPKAVVHTHKSTDQTIKIISKTLKPSVSDVFYTNQYYIVFPALAAGSKVVLVADSFFKPKKYLNDLKKYKITQFFEIPRKLQEIIDFCFENEEKIPVNVNSIITGSTPIYQSFLSNLKSILVSKTKVWCVYGMTEILPIAAIEMGEKLKYKGRGDILGRPFESVSLELAEDSELVVWGQNLCDRFLSEPKLNKVYTGDICEFDKQGNLILLSRKKDMIIKGHYNIYPTLFEQTICNINSVKDCVMLGSYNFQKQDEDVILIVIKDSEKSDYEFEKYLYNELKTGRNSIDQYALPDRIIFMKDFPVSGKNLKVDKKKLKEILNLG